MLDAVALGVPIVEEPLSGTKLHQTIGVAAGAAVEAASEMREANGGMGITNPKWRNYANSSAVLIVVLWMSVATPAAFIWLRSDAKDDRAEYRLQVIRSEQLAAESRREDRQDRQSDRETYRTTLDNISRDNRDMLTQMARSYEQMKMAGEQMKLTADTMGRIEKLLTAKVPTP